MVDDADGERLRASSNLLTGHQQGWHEDETGGILVAIHLPTPK